MSSLNVFEVRWGGVARLFEDGKARGLGQLWKGGRRKVREGKQSKEVSGETGRGRERGRRDVPRSISKQVWLYTCFPHKGPSPNHGFHRACHIIQCRA